MSDLESRVQYLESEMITLQIEYTCLARRVAFFVSRTNHLGRQINIINRSLIMRSVCPICGGIIDEEGFCKICQILHTAVLA